MGKREMKNKLYIKSLILGILVIFIGASSLPSISGYNINSSIPYSNDNPINLFLSDDFVEAYWLFDECDGDILHDSSVHGNDGTIIGPTWESYGSGCTLNFDGVDDYVDFDDHAYLDLGFNKSDDAIYSFKFQSTSTERGIIYSICRGDQYGYNPGFHIALAGNGSIELQVWRLNCGIWMYSGENFNDGSWHFVEIFYNGETANPTAEIFIDGELENTQKK